MPFAIRMQIVKEALSDPDFLKKWKKAKTEGEIETLLMEYAKAHGYKVVVQ
jgi:hypothetical protein